MKQLHFKWLLTVVLLSGAASAASVDSLLKDLKSTSKETREKALDALADMADAGFTEKESLKVLDAAAQKYEATGEYSVSAELISFLRYDPKPSMIKPIVNVFPKLDADGKWFALDVLTRLEKNTTALKTYLGLVGKHAASLDSLPIRNLKNQEGVADLLIPELFKYTKFPKLQFDIYDLALSYLYDEELTSEDIRKHEKTILNDYKALSAKLKAAQQDSGIAWRWAEPYNTDRYLGGIMLDMVGFMKTKTGDAVLKEALQFKDPHLQAWAAISLVYNEQNVPSEVFENIAASNEMRWTLYEYLEDAERLDLFPQAYRNQQALATSDLTNLLIGSDYLGYEPENIEFVQKFTRQDEDTLNDYYLFKFTDEDGVEYAGLAGPYSPAKTATVQGGDDTYTLFDEWDSRTAEGHYQAILDELYAEGDMD